MATARKAPKKVAKKAAPKKAAAKKRAPSKPKQLGRLDEYDGYRLTRKAGRVQFGCGAVTVNRADLLTVAQAQEHPGFRQAVVALKRLIDAANGNRTPEQIIAIPASILRRIAG